LGVLPLHTSRHAEFLHNEVPGITIPAEVRAAMQAAGERGGEVGLEMAGGLISDMAGLVQGTYIMPSFGRYEMAAALVRRLRASLPAAARVSPCVASWPCWRWSLACFWSWPLQPWPYQSRRARS